MRRLFRRGSVGLVVVALVIGVTVAVASGKKKTPGDEPANPATTENVHVAYLGVGLEPMAAPPAGHMPELFGGDQGVLVASVVEGSPAAKAGIVPDDVLMTYGDQKLFSPEQLAELVRGDKIGREVTLSLVREGKVEQVTVTLGEHEVASSGPSAMSPEDRDWWFRRFPEWAPRFLHVPHLLTRPTTPSERDSRWQSFDSMTIKNLGDNRFKAEIQYLNKDGKMEHQEFEGTRDEIHKAILAQKDLPGNEREQLLRSLDMPGGELEIPGFHVIPGHGFTWDFGEPSGSL